MLFEWSNPNSWPQFLGNEPYHDCKVPEELVDQFTKNYSHVRTFHSCRTDSPDSFYERGVIKSCYSDLENSLTQLAKEELNLDIPQAALDEISSRLGKYHEGSCFVVLDKGHLLHNAAHYAIYGSERLLATVNHLEGVGIQINKEVLTRRGRPTVFTIDLELADLSRSDIHSLVREINNYTHYNDLAGSLDFTFRLKNDIPANRVVQHEHPTLLRDPMDHFVEKEFRS